jgi:PKD repeat protein
MFYTIKMTINMKIQHWTKAFFLFAVLAASLPGNVQAQPGIDTCGTYFYWFNSNLDSLQVYFGYSSFFPENNNNIASITWDFGDGTTAEGEPGVTHNYAQPGIYEATVSVVTESGCAGFYTEAVTVYDPDACLPLFGYSGVAGLITTFYAYSINNVQPVAWSWDFGDGTSSTEQDPIHEYSQAGSYDVTLTITGNNGCTASITQTVDVQFFPFYCNAYFYPSFPGYPTDTKTVQFQDASYNTDPLSPLNYAWDFGDGTTSTEANPLHVYQAFGTYPVTLTVSTDNCSSVFQQDLQIDTFIYTPNCQPGFTYGASYIDPWEIQFWDYSSTEDPIVDWFWNFGDGTTGTGSQVTHQYNAPGNYEVTLTITTLVCGERVIVQPIFINEYVDCYSSFATNSVIDKTISLVGYAFYDASDAQWLWNFGDGNTSDAGPEVTHTYAQGGEYDISLTTIAADGCIHTTTWPDVLIFDSTICYANFYYYINMGGTANFYNYSYLPAGGSNSWTWDFGDGSTGTGENPVHTYTEPGYYDIVLTVSNGDCSDTYTLQAYVDEWLLQQCYASWGSYIPDYNDPNTLSFSGYSFSVDPDFSLTWNLGDGTVINDANSFNHTYAADGVYTVSLIISSANCTDTSSYDVYVGSSFNPLNAFCQPSFYYYQDQALSPETVQFFSMNTFGVEWWLFPGDTTQYLWEFGDGTTSTEIYPVHEYPATGNYFVRLFVNNMLCSAADSGYIYVGNPGFGFINCMASFGFNQSPDDPMTFTFTNQSTGEIAGAVWNFGDGTSSTEMNPTHTFQEQGTYVVSLYSNTVDSCFDNTYILLTVAPNVAYPQDCQANFQALMNGNTTNFMDMSETQQGDLITSWFWDFGDGTTSTEINPVHTYPDAGNYLATLTINTLLGCSSTYQAMAMLQAGNLGPGSNLFIYTNIGTATTDKLLSGITIQPNPVSDKLRISLGDFPAANQLSYEIMSAAGVRLSGNQVPQRDVSSGIVELSDISWLPAGSYLLRLRSDEDILVKTFIKI